MEDQVGDVEDGNDTAERRRRLWRWAVVASVIAAVAVASGVRWSDAGERPAAKETFQQIGDRTHRGLQQRSRAPVNAEPVDRTPGIGRPCAAAGDFDTYFLGASFEGIPLVAQERSCDEPPPKLRDARGRLVFLRATRMNTAFSVYGTCQRPRDPRTGLTGDGGCTPPISVSSSPACEQPHSLYRRFSGGSPVPHKHIDVRGAPAAIFKEGTADSMRVEIYTGDARVLITGTDPGVVRRAAAAILATSTSPGGARSAQAALPKAVTGAAEDDATKNPRC